MSRVDAGINQTPADASSSDGKVVSELIVQRLLVERHEVKDLEPKLEPKDETKKP